MGSPCDWMQRHHEKVARCAEGAGRRRPCGVCRPGRRAAEALRAAYAPGAKVYDGADAALEDCKANLVLDATPPFVHHAVVTRALREGRCVLGEKPMADDLDRAREMVACAQESGRPYFVMQNRRYLRGIQTLRAELAKTYLGKPYLVTCDMFLGAHFMGPGDGRPDFRNRMEHPVLVDMLIHTFDQARFLLGEKRAVSAYCQELNPPNSWYDHPAIALCTFSFEDGSVLSLRGSWATKCENTTSHGFWRVYCTDGTACWDGAERVWVSRRSPFPVPAILRRKACGRRSRSPTPAGGPRRLRGRHALGAQPGADHDDGLPEQHSLPGDGVCLHPERRNRKKVLPLPGC